MELIGYAAGVWFCVLAGVQSPLRWLASVLREVAEERPRMDQ